MSIPASRFLLRLDEAIQACSDPVQADCLRAKQVCYLGRQGHFDEARLLLADLRARHDARPRVETSVWLNLAEGMIKAVRRRCCSCIGPIQASPCAQRCGSRARSSGSECGLAGAFGLCQD